MANKIDDLLSPERLRKSWQKSNKHVSEEENANVEDQGASQILSRLKRLIEERFQGDEILALNPFLEQLDKLLIQKSEVAANALEQHTEIDVAINEALNQIEDLV